MNKLTDWILLACDELELKANFDIVVVLGHGHALRALTKILDLGAMNGMLIFSSYADVQAHEDELIQAGYGYAILDEPFLNEEFDVAVFKDMFNDWGWCGVAALRPAWMSQEAKPGIEAE